MIDDLTIRKDDRLIGPLGNRGIVGHNQDRLALFRQAFEQVENVEEFVKLDVKFHLLIAKGCRNRIMYQVVDILRGLLRKLVMRVFDKNRDQLKITFAQTMDYHRQIFEAVKSREATEARRIMEAHIKDVQKKLEKSGDFLLTDSDNDIVPDVSENEK